MQISLLSSYCNNTKYNYQPLTFNGGLSSFEKASKYIRQGDFASIESLADVFIINKDMQSLLHVSSKENSLPISKYLIKQGLGLNQVDKKGETPIFLAKTADIIKLFVNNGANINIKNKFGKTPIFKYTIQNNYELLEAAIKNGADVNVIDVNKKSPLMYATTRNIQKILLDNAASPNVKYPDGYSLIHKAIMDNNDDYVKLLLDYKPNLSVKDSRGYRPLFYVKNPEIRELLLQKGANPNEDFYLQYSLLLSDNTALEQFLRYGSNPDKIAPNGRTPIFFANSTKQIELLSHYQADLNFQDKKGNTALHQFSLLGQRLLIDKLIELGADESIKNNKGELPSDLLKLWEKYNFWVK